MDRKTTQLRPIASRKARIDWFEVWAITVICGLAFAGGFAAYLRLTDGRLV